MQVKIIESVFNNFITKDMYLWICRKLPTEPQGFCGTQFGHQCSRGCIGSLNVFCGAGNTLKCFRHRYYTL
jgi:hypothetical protein